MSTSQLPRIAGELAIIVAGILIALAADAWWDERVERQEEHAALLELRAEFRDNDEQLDSVLRIHRDGLESSRVLISMARDEVELTPDSIGALVRVIDNAWTFNPKSGALDALIASGRLDIIENDALRVALAGWSGLVSDYQEDEGGAVAYVAAGQYAMLTRVLNWADVYAPAPGRGPDPEPLRGNRELESVMAYRLSWYQSILAESQIVDEALADIRRGIEEALGTPDGGG